MTAGRRPSGRGGLFPGRLGKKEGRPDMAYYLHVYEADYITSGATSRQISDEEDPEDSDWLGCGTHLATILLRADTYPEAWAEGMHLCLTKRHIRRSWHWDRGWRPPQPAA
jgi:hypothetical protein